MKFWRIYIVYIVLGFVFQEFLLGAFVFGFSAVGVVSQSLDLGRKQDDLLFIVEAFHLVTQGLLQLLLQFFILVASYFELVGELADGSC
jgi:hypothetical protein